MIKINYESIEKLVDYLKIRNSELVKFNFYSHNDGRKIVIDKEKFPPVGGSGVVNFFFAVTIQNYGFWEYNSLGYVGPLRGVIDSKTYLGSDFLSAISMNVYNNIGHDFFNPPNLADLTFGEFLKWFPASSDFKDLPSRYKMIVEYGRAVVNKRCLSPEELISRQPNINCFLSYTSDIPGYDKDPLKKKNLLLAMIMKNRPERFLKISNDNNWPPVIDYHLMRIALRFGLVEFINVNNCRSYWLNVLRCWTSEQEGEEIRFRIYMAWQEVIKKSNLSMSKLDFLIWNLARTICLQAEDPECGACPLAGVCHKRIDLFQPIYLTTNF